MRKLADLAAAADRLALPRLTMHLPCNPSVAIHGGRIFCVYRGCNYVLAKNYEHFYARFVVSFSDSQNYLAEIAPDLTCTSAELLEDRHIRARPEFAMGFEDLRLFPAGDTLYALASGLGITAAGGQGEPPARRSTMVMLRLDGLKLSVARVLKSKRPIEKNWMPVVSGSRVDLVYQVAPFVLVEDVLDDSRPISLRPVAQPMPLTPASGGSCLIPFGDGFMAVIHRWEKVNGERHYHHQIILLDRALRVVRASERFSFEGERVEFCAGLAVTGSDLLFSYGVMDAHAIVLRLPQAAVMQALF